jgi:hypothetical protein
LVQNAGGLFIWAATACQFICEGKRFASRRLDRIVNSSSAVTASEKHLNKIYITVLKQTIHPDYTDEEKEDQYIMLRQTLRRVVVLASPVSTRSLSKLLYIAKEDIDQTLEDLHAILDISEEQTCPLRLHHPSFRNFLLNKDRCIDLKFWVDERKAYEMLAKGCTQLMSASFKQDICKQDAPSMLVAGIESSRVKQYLPQYACLY